MPRPTSATCARTPTASCWALDIAFVNGGGVRDNIKVGDITYGDIIKVHPFGNEACLVEVTGQQIKDALELGSAAYPGESGGFLQVSGLTYTINADIPSSVVKNDKSEFVKVDGAYRVSWTSWSAVSPSTSARPIPSLPITICSSRAATATRCSVPTTSSSSRTA